MAEQANSISAAIDELRAEIQHQVAHAPDPTMVIESSVETGSRDRLSLRFRSPRLANSAQAGDFVMDVAEEPLDAG